MNRAWTPSVIMRRWVVPRTERRPWVPHIVTKVTAAWPDGEVSATWEAPCGEQFPLDLDDPPLALPLPDLLPGPEGGCLNCQGIVAEERRYYADVAADIDRRAAG